LREILHQNPLRGSLALFLALSLHAQSPTVGSITNIDDHGNWFLYPDTTSSEGEKLARWQDVPAGGVIRSKSPTPGDYITIVDFTMKPIVTKKCESPTSCYEPVLLPRTPGPAPPDELTLLIRKVLKLLSAEPFDPSMHRMRAAAVRQNEDVVPLVNGRVDLRNIMQHMPPGKYSWAPYKPTVAAQSQPVNFDWEPRTTFLSIGQGKSGIYEIALLEPADTNSPIVSATVRVLLCSPKDQASLQAAFQRVRTLTGNWGGPADPGTHDFLRAYLAELAQSRHISEKP
jgi:hypothetical protein